ncbi:MAG: hypothetical protein R3C11_21525 [Planctomycetaceae bacterium]
MNLNEVGRKIDANNPYTLHLTIEGESVELRVNGLPVVKTAFANGIHNGTVGVAAYNAVTRFDNLMVDTQVARGKSLSLPVEDNFNDGQAEEFYFTNQKRWAVVAPGGDSVLRVNSSNGGGTGISNGGGTGIAYVPIENQAGVDLVVSADVRSNQVTNGWSDGFLIFDYRNEHDFKYAGFFTGQNQWVIGHYQGDWNNHTKMVDWDDTGRSIDFNQFYHLELELHDRIATLIVDGETIFTAGFDSNVTRGAAGVGAANAFSWFDNFSVRERETLLSPLADGLFANWNEESSEVLI